MNMDFLVAAAAANYSICMAAVALKTPLKTKKIKGEKGKRSCWIKPSRKSRQYYHDINIVFKEYALYAENEGSKVYSLMNETCFSELLSYIKNDITRLDTPLRKSVPAIEKLAATIRYLNTDETMSTIAKRTNLSIAFLHQSIIEVCESIYKHLKTRFMPLPTTKEQWLQIASEFESKWNFPNCLGILNGVHIQFLAAKADKLTGIYYNSEGIESVILLAMVDARGRFTFIDIGQNGSVDFNTALQCSDLLKTLKQTENPIPEPRVLENNLELPYVILADNHFNEVEHILTPYEYENLQQTDKNFNSRHAKAYENIENVFATLNYNIKAIEKVATLSKSKMMIVIQCICLMHNFLIDRESVWYEQRIQENRNKDSPRKNIESGTQKVDIVREAYKDYFEREKGGELS